MIWLLALVGIPILVCVWLVFSLAGDFWQLITFKLDFSRLFGDLFHVLFVIGIGILAEFFSLYQFIVHVF